MPTQRILQDDRRRQLKWCTSWSDLAVQPQAPGVVDQFYAADGTHSASTAVDVYDGRDARRGHRAAARPSMPAMSGPSGSLRPMKPTPTAFLSRNRVFTTTIRRPVRPQPASMPSISGSRSRRRACRSGSARFDLQFRVRDVAREPAERPTASTIRPAPPVRHRA